MWSYADVIGNRMVVCLLFWLCLYGRDYGSVGKRGGVREGFWEIHLGVDRVLKMVSKELRKMYHRRVYKIVKKLSKCGLITLCNTMAH